MAKMKYFDGTQWIIMDSKDADTVDGSHAGTAANNVLKLDTNGKVPVGNLPSASTALVGGVQLNDTTNSTSTTQAATPNSVKTVNDSLTTHTADYLHHTGYAVATGSANSYIATLSPALSAYAEGVSFRLKINASNTGASTVDVNGLGAKAIKNGKGNDVAAGNLKAGVIYTLAYDGTSFILQGEGGDLSDTDLANLRDSANNILGS
jgi:expansin (peptidoglycan-binding protein)